MVDTQLPLTVCPYSNVALKVFDDISQHTLPIMLDKGLNVSIHSDDTAHFNENIIGIANNTAIDKPQIVQMAKNAINGSFATDIRKQELNSYIECNDY